MTEEQKEYKLERRGGKRIPRKGKKLGAPRQLIGAKRYQDFLDQETIQILKSISNTRSEAIRIAAKFYKEQYAKKEHIR